ncbi:MAG: hypothetical protein RR854_02475 [Muribaculaceae bacterium]
MDDYEEQEETQLSAEETEQIEADAKEVKMPSDEPTNELFNLIFKDARICHFVADLIAGMSVDDAAKRNFVPTQNVLQIDDAIAKEVCDAMKWAPEMWDSVSHAATATYYQIMNGECSAPVITLLCKGIDYDCAVLNAENMGYVRGRNEKIELLKRSDMASLSNTEKPQKSATHFTTILENTRRSVWDD